MTMPLQVEPTELLPRALTGVAKLIAATEQFQIETGKTEDASLLQHCRWPEIRQGTYAGQQATSPDPLTAPLAIVSMEPNSGSELLSRAYRDIADGELFVQLALVENGNYAANEDRWNDAANRFGAIMRQMLELGASRISNRWQVTRWAMHQPPELNNLQKFPFVKLVGDELVEVRVWVFPAVVTWVG